MSQSALQQGFYALRHGPAFGVGGMYATGNVTDTPIFIGAQVPSLHRKQSWAVTPVVGKHDMYTIALANSDVVGAFGTPKNKVTVNAPVVLAAKPQNWRIVKSKTASVSDAYEIHADTCAKCPGLVISVPGVGNELKLVKLDSVKGDIPYFKFYGKST
ncbi:hypothetical protein HGRIS_011060 [Hohenbuehelia grisea]|uniref:Uncharacterized protein n=1 Tax=Hohenbuehelia grisea TaxID=104357 RepID=A0ABR3IYV2_9AGAR